MIKNKSIAQFFGIGIILVFALTMITSEVWARAGGGFSGGFRGSRSFSAPRTPSSGTSQFQGSTPSPSTGLYEQSFNGQPLSCGALAGGLAGGFLGSMLFGGMGHGWGGGGLGGSGFGFLEIILLIALLFIVFRFIRGRKMNQQNQSRLADYASPSYQQPGTYSSPLQGPDQDVETGIAHIQSMDPNFDPMAFKDWVQDLFFKIQAAWGNQDLSPVDPFLTDQMKGIFSQDLQEQKAANQINRLENIAVRSVDITEAWQEEGKDFIIHLVLRQSPGLHHR